MARLEDVKTWLLLNGVGHVLASTHHGWHTTACLWWTPNGTVTTTTPRRKCRMCITNLSLLKAHSGGKDEGHEDV